MNLWCCGVLAALWLLQRAAAASCKPNRHGVNFRQHNHSTATEQGLLLLVLLLLPAGVELPRSYLDVLSACGAIGLLLGAMECLEPRQVLLPVSLINRLVLTGQAVFSTQYVQVGWRWLDAACWVRGRVV